MPLSTKFNKVPYTIAGDSFISSAKDLSIQNTLNMIAVPAPNSLTDSAALYSWPCLKAWSSGAAVEYDRGIHPRTFLGLGYKVSGNTLYSFTSTGTQVSVGTIGGSGLVSSEDNGTLLLIISSGVCYNYDGTTLSTLTLSFTPVDVGYLNNQFIMLASDGFIYVADVGTTNFDAINSFDASSSPDPMVGLQIFNQFLFNAGSKTIEPWENTGVGNPPMARMNGAIIEDAGIASKNAMATTSDAIYFMGSDYLPYRLINFQAQKLTDNNPGIAELFSGYTISSCFLQSATVYGQEIIIFFFPVDNKTWCYSQETGLWFQLDHDVNASIYKGVSFAEVFGKTLVGDRENGNIYELDEATYQNASTTMVRERIFRPMAGETAGSIRANLQMRAMQFAVESGVGVDDDSPQMMVSYSTNGGRSFGSERWLSLGEEGDYLERIEDYSNQKFKDLVVKIRYTSNTRFTLYDAAIYIRESGR